MRERRQSAGSSDESGLRGAEATTEEGVVSDAGVRKRRAGDASASAAEFEPQKKYAFGRAHPDAEQARGVGLPCDARATAGRRQQ